MPPMKPSIALRFAAFSLSLLSACTPINVMGRNVPESEYRAMYDADMAREKRGLPQINGHDENGRVAGWDEYWCTIGGTSAVPATARTRRLKRYIIAHRRALGLPELCCASQ